MKILFVGTFVPPHEADKYSGVSIAGNQMQGGFIKGFHDNGIRVEAISVTPRAMAIPGRRKEKIIQKALYEEYEGIRLHKIGYINLPFLKQVSTAVQIYRKLKKLTKNADEEKTVLLVYNSVSYFCEPAFWISRKRSIECCGIIADLPVPGTRKGLIWKWENQYEINAISKFDKLVPLTKHIALDYAPKTPYVVVEAGIEVPDEKINNGSLYKRNIVYTGALNSLSGMDLILKIAEKCKGYNIVFDIYGRGEYGSILKQAEANGLPIRYHGAVVHKEAIKAQKDAGILICPRMPDDFATRYTFPSKVLEYISRGRPVICNRLKGIPEEYEMLVNFADDASSTAWLNLIEDIFENYDSYLKKSIEAKIYARERKNWKKCTQKVLNMLCACEI